MSLNLQSEKLFLSILEDSARLFSFNFRQRLKIDSLFGTIGLTAHTELKIVEQLKIKSN